MQNDNTLIYYYVWMWKAILKINLNLPSMENLEL